jgi:translation initiation factor 5A
MAFKLINAVEAKPGATILVDGEACIVRSLDVSRPGKHGHAKCRIEAIGITDGKKRVLAIPGHERLDVPLVEKRKAQVLSTSEGNASVMDLESFETIDVPIVEELKGQLNAEDQVEYVIIDEGQKIIKRKL